MRLQIAQHWDAYLRLSNLAELLADKKWQASLGSCQICDVSFTDLYRLLLCLFILVSVKSKSYHVIIFEEVALNFFQKTSYKDKSFKLLNSIVFSLGMLFFEAAYPSKVGSCSFQI